MARLLHGDCLTHLAALEPGSVDLILADMPYGTTKNEWDVLIDFEALWPLLWRVLKQDGAVVLFSAGPFTGQLMCSQMGAFKYKIVWVKSKATNFLNVDRQPLRKHEDVCVFYREQPAYHQQRSPGEGYDKGVRSTQTGSYGEMTPTRIKSDGGRAPTDVVYFATAEHEGEGVQPIYHPTQKPIALGRYLVRTYSNPGDTVLDFCCGSGSLLVAAAIEQRIPIGIELSAGFVDVTRTRLKRAAPLIDVAGDGTVIARSQQDLF